MSKRALEIWDFFQWQVDNSQQWSQSLRNTKKIKGVNEVYIGETRSDIKEVKKIIEGLSHQIASLMVAKSIEPHAYNQYDHDSYPNQVNVINVMKKQSNYIFTPILTILDGEIIPTFHGLNDSNRRNNNSSSTSTTISSSTSATILIV